jgi:aspartate aminotransferase
MLNDGDEVILPAPYWVSYFEIVKLSGGVPVEVPTSVDTDFKITPEQLEAQSHQKQNDVVQFSCNPSGSVYNREELTALAKVLEKYPTYTLLLTKSTSTSISGTFAALHLSQEC